MAVKWFILPALCLGLVLLFPHGEMICAGLILLAFIPFLDRFNHHNKVLKELAETRRRLNLILETIPVRVFWKDRNSIYQGCNRLFAMDAGLHGPEEILGKDDFHLPWKKLATGIQERDQEVMDSNTPQLNYAETIEGIGGESMGLRVSKAPILGANQEVIGVLGAYDDITEHQITWNEKERLTSQLKQSQKMESIGMLAGGIAHDFNNIIFGAQGFAEIARTKVDDGSRAAFCVDQILVALGRAEELVKQILTFSKKSEQELSPIKIQQVVKDAFHVMHNTAPSNIEMFQMVDETCGPVLGDPVQIREIVMNLCSNAAQAAEKSNGQVRVQLSPVKINDSEAKMNVELHPGDYVRLSVQDTGCGMDKETCKRIFEPYFTTKKVGEGAGLGLSIVHGIVRRHKGVIEVESQPGSGTLIRIFFPIKGENGSNTAEENRNRREMNKKKQILFVDDEEQIITLAKYALGKLGYPVRTFTSSEKALEAFMATPDAYSMVITDQNMPELKGKEMAQRILELRPEVPILLCSGNSDSVREEAAFRMGISRTISKPIRMKELAKTIKEVLKGERQDVVHSDH